ncbi:Lon protease family protein [Methylocaldum sp.]|uniref:Lon protease family protein n=1 Tax=Methylocaldum sp. TaxID=1969727 RepID=UPI002D2DA97A|nr:AAA family ATPase [Methylocaldum sp.]HYE34007.1 AAA family ATPase [Methylocaldum sp.]
MGNHRQPLPASVLYKACNPREFDFSTTDELADIGVVIGQERALDAIQFGISIAQKGYNIFALGPSGSGKLAAVTEIVSREAENQPVPDNWCYVNNFAEASKPKALKLPAGQGPCFARDMEQVIEELSTVIPAAFEGEEYRNRAEEIEEEAKEREVNAINELRRKSLEHDIALIETPTGFAFAPVDKKSEVLGPEQFQKLSEHQQQQIQEAVADLRHQLQRLLKQFPAWRKEAKDKLKALNREIAEFAVNHLMDDLKARYQAIPGVVQYLDEAQREIIDHAEDFFPKQEGGMAALTGHAPRPSPFLRYKVNLLVDHGERKHAPVIFESLPSHNNLVGRVEYQAYMGTLITDFTMIKPGALHLANGGYLILDARKLLMQPFAWDSLKRILESGEIRIESLERTLSVISTSSLEPEPIPVNLKIVLIGDRILYYLLNVYDPEFRELFKVSADFEETVDRDADGNALYARLIASLARRNQLRPLDKDAVIRVVEHAARLVEDSEKLSTHLRSLDDLLKESDHWAAQVQRSVITRDDVQAAIDHQIRRADRLRERIYENIRRGTIFIDTAGAVIGQVNGLSVVSLGDFAFGQPSRITATTRLGAGKILDIERESELGGAIHSKGVMILSGFLAQRYAKTQPFSVAASLVFEQSYGQVEGDSASVAELSAILSSLADLPIRQSLAITGSVNQHGQVQPIGGVNEKIEGFFDICKAAGLNGKQGVVIPNANVKHLMLRHDIVKAAESGTFHVYAVDTVDQALELLMDRSVGERDITGAFPLDSINGRIERRLKEWMDIQKELRSQEKAGEKDNHG